jgi:chromate transport protein ChrA
MADHTQLAESAKYFFDGISVVAILATLSAVLPPMAALVSLVWGLIRIYETKTVQGWLKKKRRSAYTRQQQRKVEKAEDDNPL